MNMKKNKALKKDLKTRFSSKLTTAVVAETSKPSKKVKKLIKSSSRKMADAVYADVKKDQKRAAKAEKKVAKAEKKKIKGEKKTKGDSPVQLAGNAQSAKSNLPVE